MARQYKLARKMKKITLTVAAEDLGVSQPTLSAWESGRRSPTIEALIRMYEYYGVTVDFFAWKSKRKRLAGRYDASSFKRDAARLA